ncbi:MAG: M48 family metalloprotease [Nitrososphaerota archaeon]|jgi:heat shock protein HtpX|nr:M48 family metalloprotease [Nitrososphaerota archaeon]
MMPPPFLPFTYRLDPEVPPSYYEKLFEFIYTQYLLPQNHRFIAVTKESSLNNEKLSYTITNPQSTPLLEVEIKSGTPIELTITPLNASVQKAIVEEAKQDILITLQVFSQNVRNTTICFAWQAGEKIIPEDYTKPEKSFNRLFFETQVLFFMIFIAFGMFTFIAIALIAPQSFWIAPLILISIQFIFVFYSNRFIARKAEWHITQTNPLIHILEYYLPVSALSDFKKSYTPKTLRSIKKQIYEEIIAKQGRVDPESAQQIFLNHNMPCEIQNLKTKEINVYLLVKNISERFHFPMPKIIISNTLVPNAAASGPSPKRSLVLLTTGILAQLNEAELLGVLGHEFGHLRGRDPLILYGLISTEFLFRFYVLLPLFPVIFSSLLFFLYFWAIMVFIFFIAKFFEARADLISAMVVGNPHILAESLEKIGFQRLLCERIPSYRIQEWLGMDPHPPIYFRVNRLECLQPETIRYPLIQSIKDVTRGFIATLRR